MLNVDSIPAPSALAISMLSYQRMRSSLIIRNSRIETQAQHARDDVSQLLQHRIRLHIAGHPALCS